MVKLNDVVGENPMRKSIEKKLGKVQGEIDALYAKLEPLVEEKSLYNKMLDALDDHEARNILIVTRENNNSDTAIIESSSTAPQLPTPKKSKPAFLRNLEEKQAG